MSKQVTPRASTSSNTEKHTAKPLPVPPMSSTSRAASALPPPPKLRQSPPPPAVAPTSSACADPMPGAMASVGAMSNATSGMSSTGNAGNMGTAGAMSSTGNAGSMGTMGSAGARPLVLCCNYDGSACAPPTCVDALLRAYYVDDEAQFASLCATLDENAQCSMLQIACALSMHEFAYALMQQCIASDMAAGDGDARSALFSLLVMVHYNCAAFHTEHLEQLQAALCAHAVAQFGGANSGAPSSDAVIEQRMHAVASIIAQSATCTDWLDKAALQYLQPYVARAKGASRKHSAASGSGASKDHAAVVSSV